MRKFFGRNVNDSGTEILIKLGSRYPDINDPRHYTNWRDGQVIDISPIGVNSGKRVGYSSLLIQFPNVRYAGRNEDNWKHSTPVINNFRKYVYPVDKNGRYPWNYKATDLIKSVRKRDYFVDTLELLTKKYISLSEYEIIYDFTKKSPAIVIPNASFTDFLKHEDSFLRTSFESDTKHASIAQDGAGSGTGGGFTIGAAGDYATWTAFEADLSATLTGDLHGLGLDEETAITGIITYDIDCDGNTLYLMAETGDEHNGSYYGNGARVNFGSYDIFALIDDGASGANMTDVLIQSMAFDISSYGNVGVRIDESASGGLVTVNRLLIKGDENSTYGIDISFNFINVLIKNNIVYGVGNGGQDSGIHFSRNYPGQTLYCYNNTCIKNYNNFVQDDTNSFGTYVVKNNLAQGDIGGADWVDDGGGFGTTAKNYDEDGSGPDSLTGNFHDGTSNFIDYASDDYRIDPDGDAIATLKAGEDLTGTFTDDIDGDTRTSGEFFIGADWIDTGGGSTGASQTESIGIEDVQDASNSTTASQTESIGIEDVQDASNSTTAPQTESIGIEDVQDASTTFPVSQTESIGIEDIQDASTTFPVSQTESIGIDDVQDAAVGNYSTVAESVGIEDVQDASNSTTAPQTESIGIEDVQDASTTFPVSQTESIGIEDVQDASTTFPVSQTESIGIEDVQDAAVGNYSTVAESVGIEDVQDASTTFPVSQTESIGIEDVQDASVTFHVSIVESIGIEDIQNGSTATTPASVTESVGVEDVQDAVVMGTANTFNAITDNLKNTFDGQTITYNSVTKTITCELERTVNVIDNRYPFVKVSGPIAEVLHRSRRRARVDLHYLVEFIDNSVNDSYESGNDPISKILGSVEADLLVMAMANRDRGGYANNTEWDGAGYYFDDSNGVSLFVKWIQLRIEVNVIESDPHYR